MKILQELVLSQLLLYPYKLKASYIPRGVR